MRPNLSRIPGDQDWLAMRILDRVQGDVDARFVASLSDKDRRALARYGERAVSIALRERSVARLESALLASAVSEPEPWDGRDVMVGISLHHVVARMIGVEPGLLFSRVADRLPGGSMATLVREFGAREDVTLEAFAWERVDTPDGPDFRPV